MKFGAVVALLMLAIVMAPWPVDAQSTGGNASVFQSTAKAKEMAFDVASVKPSKSSDRPYSNFSLGPGDAYVPNGGYFAASNLPLFTYIAFAYKIQGNEGQYLLPQLPSWVISERFDIQARAEGNPGKDDMRTMMRALLADRFKLKIHTEKREIPVFELVLTKPGKTGPQLRLHTDDGSCPTAPAPGQTVEGGFPALCGGILRMPPTAPGRMRLGARKVTVAFIADSVSLTANLGRPMLDQTGITGPVDFLLEFVPDSNGLPVAGGRPPSNPERSDAHPDLQAGPTFQEAMREQLGIKLQPQKSAMDVLVVDHIEDPSEN